MDSLLDEEVAGPYGGKRRILIADDNLDIQEMLQEIFAREGFLVSSALDGEEAVRLTAESCPDLVLLDLRMPRQDGLNVLRRIRETDLDTAIVVHTAFGSEALGLEALRAGADDYLKKPVPLGVLIERVNAVLIAKEGHNALRQRAELRMRESEELYRATAAELAARVATIDITQEIARGVLSNLDLRDIGQTIVTQWRRLLPYDRASIGLLDPDDPDVGIVLAVYERGQVGGPAIGSRFRYSEGIRQTVIERKLPYRVDDLLAIEEGRRLVESIRLRGVRSVMVHPVLINDRVAATINLAAAEPGAFTGRHEAIAMELVGPAAIAIQNAQLYRDLQESYASLERAQTELLRRERLAALGQISAVMAHEVRNPLGVIYNTLGPLRELLPPEGDPAMLLSIVEEEANRLNRIVVSLLDFARPTTLQLSDGDLVELIDEVVRNAVSDATHQGNIVVEKRCSHNRENVVFDAQLLRQALLNLLLNGFQAIGRSGKVIISTRDELRDGKVGVSIEVRDDGIGIRPELIDRIFDPFFTTKAAGTGLGLPIVKRIVEDHHGSLEVSSKPKFGTSFRLWIPSQH